MAKPGQTTRVARPTRPNRPAHCGSSGPDCSTTGGRSSWPPTPTRASRDYVLPLPGATDRPTISAGSKPSGANAMIPSDGPSWTGWWPSLDLDATRRLARGSRPHETGLALLSRPGRLALSAWVRLPPGKVAFRIESTRPIEEATLGDAQLAGTTAAKRWRPGFRAGRGIARRAALPDLDRADGRRGRFLSTLRASYRPAGEPADTWPRARPPAGPLGSGLDRCGNRGARRSPGPLRRRSGAGPDDLPRRPGSMCPVPRLSAARAARSARTSPNIASQGPGRHLSQHRGPERGHRARLHHLYRRDPGRTGALRRRPRRGSRRRSG